MRENSYVAIAKSCASCECDSAQHGKNLFPRQRGATALKKSTRGSHAKKLQTAAVSEPDSRSLALEDANKTASYVAHELNNLLTVIQINTEFLLESAGENPASAQELAEIQRAARRASILARQLLASSRLEPFDANLAEAALKKKSFA